MKKQMTREEIEAMLEKRYRGKVIGIMLPYPPPTSGMRLISGKVDNIAVEVLEEVREPMVVFIINHERYTADVNYFIQHVTVYGNTH